MRAVVIDKPHGKISIADVAEPKPGSGEVSIEVAYVGCNFADAMMTKGTYPHPKGYPLVMGLEPSGRIVEVGSGVEDFRVGDRVVAFSEGAGAFADRIVVPAERLVRIPDSMALETAAAFCLQGLTAWHLLHNVSDTLPGDTILLNAIGGGVGLMATQIAVSAGAKVIGTIGTRGKERRPLEFGAVKVINREDEDFVAATLAFTDGKGVDKVLDSTGATILDRSFDAIRKLGHIVSFGEAEGRPLPNLWERIVRKSITFSRFHLGHVDFQSQVWRRSVAETTQAVASGKWKAVIEQVFPFDQCEAMCERLTSRQVSGKLLLAVKPE